MPITRQIPVEAEPVLRMLVDVHIPEASHWTATIFEGELEIEGARLRCRDGKCPMGLHPDAKSNYPTWRYDFVDETKWEFDGAIDAFLMWWDYQTDAEAALEELRKRIKEVS